MNDEVNRNCNRDVHELGSNLIWKLLTQLNPDKNIDTGGLEAHHVIHPLSLQVHSAITSYKWPNPGKTVRNVVLPMCV